MDAGFAVLLLEPTSVLDPDAAVDIDPRGSLEWDLGLLSLSSGSSRIGWRPEGVGGGLMNATVFFGPSSFSRIPPCFRLLLRPAESVLGTGRGWATDAVPSEPSSSTSDNGPRAYDPLSCDR